MFLGCNKMKIYTNIKPHLSEGAEFSWANEEELTKKGLSIHIDFSNPLTTGFNEGRTYLLTHYENITIPPLWALAHTYINNEKARHFLNQNLVTTSSIRQISNNEFYVFHTPKFNKYYNEYIFSFFHPYPIKIPLKLEDYPEEDLSLENLINNYPKTAKALFLMNEQQLNEFLLKIPKINYNKEKPAIQGVSFIDSREHKGIKPYLFGFRRGGSVEEKDEFFGVTTIQYIPVISYPIEFRRKNETQVTYSPKQFYELTRKFEELKISFQKKKISGSVNKKIENKIKNLEEALYNQFTPD